MSGRRFVLLAVVAGLILWLIYSIRPLGIIHLPLLYLYVYPLVWIIPTFAALLSTGIFLLRRRYSTEFGRRSPAATALIVYLCTGLVVYVPTAIVAPRLSAKATFDAYDYEKITALPSGGQVRVMPRRIADQMALQASNTAGYTLGGGHIVLDPATRELTWTFEQAPHGLWNSLKRPTLGIAGLNASITDREMKHTDRKFKFAPGMHISQNTGWQIVKRHFWSRPSTGVAIVGTTGEPMFVQPYIRYKGFPVRHPVVGGVTVFHPDGTIEDLTVAEAAKRPVLVDSGRIFPEDLARQVQDAYGYRNGVKNTFFGHRGQTVVDDPAGEKNRMPYLMSFVEKGVSRMEWVSVAEPYGKAFATNAIFLTDAVTGRTQTWLTTPDQSLTGAERSLQTVRQVGSIVWSNFEAIEPRPIFVRGKLQYMISVVSSNASANSVSKTMIVDASSNKVVATFNHDTDPGADDKLRLYLVNGQVADPDAGSTGSSGGDTTEALIATLLRRNSELRRQLDEQTTLLKQLEARVKEVERAPAP